MNNQSLKLIAKSTISFRNRYNVSEDILGKTFFVTLDKCYKAKICLPFGNNGTSSTSPIMDAPIEYDGKEKKK